MTWTSTTVAYIDGLGGAQTAVAYTNGTQKNPAYSLLDSTGAIIGSTNPLTTTSPGSVHLTAAPAVTAGAYSTGFVVGGLVSLSSAARINAGSGIVQSVNVTAKTNLTAAYDVLFFDTNPSNSTFTDNLALAINTADLPSLCGVAHCTDLISGGTPQILQATNLGLPFKLSAAATTLYAVIVIRGAQSYASTSAVNMSVVILQD